MLRIMYEFADVIDIVLISTGIITIAGIMNIYILLGWQLRNWGDLSLFPFVYGTVI